MNVITAESAGFCFGVARAVEMCERACESGGCVTVGPLIHNTAVTDELAAKGVREVSYVSEVAGNETVVIRSHGIGKADYKVLRAKNVKIIDATCPFVENIHRIVENAEKKGRLPIIIGQRNHHEIIGIAGWCEKCMIFETAEEFDIWLQSPQKRAIPLTIVFQTTETRKIFDYVSEIAKKECTNIEIFDTICDATNRRQSEAAKLSEISDVFIVIGGHQSANSLRLAEIASKKIERVYFIENADELDMRWFEPGDTVGITAGASTPARIIKEVNRKMFEETEVRNDEITGEQHAQEEAALKPVAEDTLEQPVAEGTQIEEPGNTKEPEETGAEEREEVEEPQEAETVDAEAVVEAVEAVAEPEEERPLSFEEMLEQSIKTLHTGEKVTGVVAAITSTEITVDLGTKQSGYIPMSELTDDPSLSVEDIVKVGENVEAIVMRVNDVEGTVMLSRRRLDALRSWSDIEAAMEQKTVVEGVVTEDNKGGVVVMIRGQRVFVPASRTGLPRSAAMSELVRQKVRLIITEVNQPRRRIVGSISAVINEERRQKAEQVWAEIEEGKRYKGVVKSLTSYGAFVDIGGVDGMVHVSELSWTHIAKPADMLSVGDEIEVYVISFDREKKKISLGYKDHSQNPWVKFTEANRVGDVVSVKVVKLMKFGAFAEILPGVDGLIHVSQIANYRIGEPNEVLSEGQVVGVKIVDIDNERQKVSLSIRALLSDRNEPPVRMQYEEPAEDVTYTEDDEVEAEEAAADEEVSGEAPETAE